MLLLYKVIPCCAWSFQVLLYPGIIFCALVLVLQISCGQKFLPKTVSTEQDFPALVTRFSLRHFCLDLAQCRFVPRQVCQTWDHSEASDEAGARRFRFWGLPADVQKSGVKQILGEMGWSPKVLHSQGKQTWLVSSDKVPPTRAVKIADYTAAILEDIPQGQGLVVASANRDVCHSGPTDH